MVLLRIADYLTRVIGTARLIKIAFKYVSYLSYVRLRVLLLVWAMRSLVNFDFDSYISDLLVLIVLHLLVPSFVDLCVSFDFTAGPLVSL